MEKPGEPDKPGDGAGLPGDNALGGPGDNELGREAKKPDRPADSNGGVPGEGVTDDDE